ncbi:MAG: nitroreductase family protein [Desulfovibrionaceae bacterium]
MLTVNKEQCAQDGLCAAACPIGLIRLEADGGYPAMREGMDAACIRCGHCVAICPKGVLEVDGVALGDCQSLHKDLAFSAEAVEQFMKSRRSVRAYKDAPVDKALIARLLDTARFAPSGHNAQPVEWAVAATRPAVVRVIDATVAWMREACGTQPDLAAMLHMPGIVRAWEHGKDIVGRGATAMVAAHLPQRGVTPDTDGHIALAWVELAAHAHNLGACWAGYVSIAARHCPAVAAAFGIPGDRVLGGALMLGHPAMRYARIPPRIPLRAIWSE